MVLQDSAVLQDPPARGRVLAAPALVAGLITGGLILGGLATGCGTPSVAPETWAKSVCSALTPWRARVADLTNRAQQEINQTKTPIQTKQSLSALLAGAKDASEQARRRIVEAGVPDVDDGAKAAGQFETALTRARDAYGRAAAAVAGLNPAEADPFYDAVDRAFKQLTKEYSTSSLDIDEVGPEALHRAFDKVPECR